MKASIRSRPSSILKPVSMANDANPSPSFVIYDLIPLRIAYLMTERVEQLQS